MPGSSGPEPNLFHVPSGIAERDSDLKEHRGLGGHGGDLCGTRALQDDAQVSQCQHGLMSAPTHVNVPSAPRSTNTPGHDPTR